MNKLGELRRRYEAYGHLMAEAADAIADQDDLRLAEVTAAGADLLTETQRHWTVLEEAAVGGTHMRDDLARLRETIADALVRVTANRAALDAWLNDTRARLRTVGQGRLATSGYRCRRGGDLAGCDTVA